MINIIMVIFDCGTEIIARCTSYNNSNFGNLVFSKKRLFTNLEWALSKVAAVCLLAAPLSSILYTSFRLCTITSSRPWMTTEPYQIIQWNKGMKTGVNKADQGNYFLGDWFQRQNRKKMLQKCLLLASLLETIVTLLP